MASGGDNLVLVEGASRVVGAVDLDALVAYVEGLAPPFSTAIKGRTAESEPDATRKPLVVWTSGGREKAPSRHPQRLASVAPALGAAKTVVQRRRLGPAGTRRY
jgi:hypothetical protein